jgi:hypothetical protein
MYGDIVRMSASEFQVVNEAIAGHREVDEHALAAMAVLQDRLERVKALGGGFSGIGFSSDVRKLQQNKSLAAVG